MAMSDWRADFKREQAAFRRRHGYSELERILLDRAGKRVVLQEEPDLGPLLNEGEFVAGGRAVYQKMKACNCHGNAADLWRESAGHIQIATGWALSNGIWLQHSWGWDPHFEHIIETTEKRSLYYGFVLDYEQAEVFADFN